MSILHTLCIVLCTVVHSNGLIAVKRIFYQVSNLDQFDGYGDVDLFVMEISEATHRAEWSFLSGTTNQKCPLRNISIYLQHGSYPLPYASNNNTYPKDAFLPRSSLHQVGINSSGDFTYYEITQPQAGRWFGIAFIDFKENDEVIKQLDSLDCEYYLLINMSHVYELDLSSLSLNTSHSLSVSGPDSHYYRFFIEQNVWQFNIICAGVSPTGTCDFVISVESGQFPSDQSLSLDCTSTANCTLAVVSPVVNRWHYLKVDIRGNRTVHAVLTVSVIGCPTFILQDSIYLTDDIFVNLNRSELDTEDPANDTSANLTTPGYDWATTTALLATTGQPLPPVVPSSSCTRIRTLYRIEDMNTAPYSVFSLSSKSPYKAVFVNPHQVAIVQFDLDPVKDIGGTLLFKALISEVAINQPNHTQDVTVRICLSPHRIPNNQSDYYCPPDVSSELLLDTESDDTGGALRLIPYPQPGTYFVGFQSFCYIRNDSSLEKFYEPCVENYTKVVFQISNGPCVDKECGGHGDCYTYRKGAFIFSACNCHAGYRGYTCEDGLEAPSDSNQLLYTCFLSISNIFFVPAIVLGTYRRYYVEALVYFANMFFSGFYHACDMNTWSIYKLCIMPYHVLSYCDFLLSIMSFWVTLIAMADLPYNVTSVLHMLGVLALAMAVTWQQFSLLVYVIPITTGAVLVIAMWLYRRVKSKKCYPPKTDWFFMIPGFILAVIGLVIYAFLQNDINYPYTHSAWHTCIATSVVFLLPRRRSNSLQNISCQSSDDIEFNERLGENDLSYLIDD